MAKLVILLAGLHKTATTSIQRACVANQDKLQEAGLIIPLTSHEVDNAGNHSNMLHLMFREAPHRAGTMGQFSQHAPAEAARAKRQRRAGFAAKLQRTQRDVVLMAEGVSTFSAAELGDMKAWFAEHGRDVRLVCHVRHLGSWLNSMVAQRVVAGPRLSLAAALDEFVQRGSLVRHRIENLREVFADAEFYSHEQAARHAGGPAGFFFEKLGAAAPKALATARANEGNSEIAVRAMSILNEKFGRYLPDGSPNAKILDEQALPLRRIGGEKFVLRAHDVTPLLPLIEAENQWLKEALGPGFHDGQLSYSPEPFAWTKEHMEQLAPALAGLPAEARSWVVERLK